VLSFLGRIFIEPNAGGQPAAALISQLDDELYALNIRLGDDAFPRTAQAYLDEWASPEKGWLRKYYPVGTDEAHYDVTPPVEKAPALDQGSADPGFRRHGVTTEYVVRAAPSDGVRGGHRSRQFSSPNCVGSAPNWMRRSHGPSEARWRYWTPQASATATTNSRETPASC
jgi:Protein of unknown function (DUF3375)